MAFDSTIDRPAFLSLSVIAEAVWVAVFIVVMYFLNFRRVAYGHCVIGYRTLATSSGMLRKYVFYSPSRGQWGTSCCHVEGMCLFLEKNCTNGEGKIWSVLPLGVVSSWRCPKWGAHVNFRVALFAMGTSGGKLS